MHSLTPTPSPTLSHTQILVCSLVGHLRYSSVSVLVVSLYGALSPKIYQITTRLKTYFELTLYLAVSQNSIFQDVSCCKWTISS